MAAGKRFKFSGSKVRISMSDGAPKTITDIDQSDPAVVSAATHGFLLGTVVRIAAVVGMTEVNNKLFVVDNPDTGDFELAGVDSTGYTAYTSGGTATPLVFGDFCELTSISQQDGTPDEIEATTICSTAKEFETGLSDSGTLTLDYNYAPNEAVQARFAAAKKSGEQIAIQVVLPNAGGTVVMIGTVQSSSFTGSNGSLWTGSTSIKLTGEVYAL